MRQTLLILGGAILALLVLAFLAPTWAATARPFVGPQPVGTPTPAPLPTGLTPPNPVPPTPAEGEEAALPDLIAASITTDPINPLVNVTCTILVTIKNESDTPLGFTNNFYTDLYVNPQSTNLKGKRGDVWWGVQGFYMGARQSYVMTTSWVFTDVVAQNLWAQVDTPTPATTYGFPRGDVLERDEENNIQGPHYVQVITNQHLVQQNHVDFMRGMCNSLDVVPISGTVGVITNTPGVTITGDSAMILGVFEEPPYQWGASANTDDYNAKWPDRLLNSDAITSDQSNPIIAASGDYLVAVWQDGRYAPIYGTHIYMTWSSDQGTTWYTPTIRVNDDGVITGTLHEHPSVAVAANGDVVVAWQDRRNDNFDIYVQQYQITGTPPALIPMGVNTRVNTDAGNSDQIYPDIAVDAEGRFYIAWQDQRNGNDDIFAVRSVGSGPALQWDDDTLVSDEPTRSKQSNPSIDVIKAIKVTIRVEPPTCAPEVITHEQPIIVVAWEDWRNGNPDIYIVHSEDNGETFHEDTRVNQDPLYTRAGHFDPAIAVTMGSKQVTFPVNSPGCPDVHSVNVVIPVAYVHVVWQDYRNSHSFYPDGTGDDPDIYYARFSYEPSYVNPSIYAFTFEAEEKVNHDDDGRPWQNGPVWQGFPEIDGKSFHLPGDIWEYDVYIVWADGRNYGGEENNYDIYLQVKTNAATGFPSYLENNIIVNDGIKLHNFHPEADPTYRIDSPPPARQIRPSVVSTLDRIWPGVFLGSYIYVVWDDDRIADPFVNRDIYFARTNTTFINHAPSGPFDPPPGVPGRGYYYGSGTYVSEILDTGNYSSTWYIADWHAITRDGTYITLQTRLGNTITDVLSSDWYPNRNVPIPGYWPFPDGPGTPPASIGAPLEGYDAPGQHIVDASGKTLPTARYIQYKVNMWTKNYGVVYTPELFDVILHYNAPTIIYLPLVFKNAPA